MGDADLLKEMGVDAQKWAEQFCKQHGVVDHGGSMLGWFANAIEAGKSAGAKAEREACLEIAENYVVVDHVVDAIRDRSNPGRPLPPHGSGGGGDNL